TRCGPRAVPGPADGFSQHWPCAGLPCGTRPSFADDSRFPCAISVNRKQTMKLLDRAKKHRPLERLAPEHPGEVAALPGGWLLRQHLKWPKPWCPEFLRRAAGARLTPLIAIRGRKSQDDGFFCPGPARLV